MNILTRTTITLLTLGSFAAAHADESTLALKEAPDAVIVRAQCSICHSVDFIQMNAPFMKRAAWEAEVRKMVQVMGAPVPENDVARIINYLTQNYGVE